MIEKLLNSLGYYKKTKPEIESTVSENKTPSPEVLASAPIMAPAMSGEGLPGYTASGEKKVKCPICGGYYGPTYLKYKHQNKCKGRQEKVNKKTCMICGQQVSNDQYSTHTAICKTLKGMKTDETTA